MKKISVVNSLDELIFFLLKKYHVWILVIPCVQIIL